MIIAYSPCHDTYLHGQDQFHLVKSGVHQAGVNIAQAGVPVPREHGEKVAVHVQVRGDFRQV